MTTARRAAAQAARRSSERGTAREAAVLILSRVDHGDAYANLLLSSVLGRAQLSEADAGLATELVLGTLRQRARVDWTLAGALRRPLDDLPPRIRAVLRTGAYQLLFLARIPPHAAVDEAVSLARTVGHAGTAKLTNAVLRRIASEGERPLPAGSPTERIAVEHSHPQWLIDRWLRRFGDVETEALCRANNSPSRPTVRVNTLKLHPDEAVRRFDDLGITVTRTAIAEGLHLAGPVSDRHRVVTEGLCTMQDLAAMLVTHILDPQPGEMVIDGAAAPGGKTTHIAERMRDRGRIIACDIHAAKLERLRHRVARMGISIVEAHEQDARGIGRTFPRQADRVLLDAPCTGLGVLRRRPDIKWRVLPEDINALAVLQQQMVQGACDAVRPGGMLVYSVCTTEEEEGQKVVEEFLREHEEFRLEMPDLPDAFRSAVAASGAALLLPHRHGTDGFFIARMRRRADN
ncbi:MAG TPA: 16S rRNA (cytosine(967)-C(5))-methyltransferase RsmB [bacterium]|nr:16S rRNA (cytosine(967)-C(5))-methyltransferase RsmB [bacterium]